MAPARVVEVVVEHVVDERPAIDDRHQATYRIGKRLLPLDGRFSARRGTYRVIYRIDDTTRVVTVVDIAHRRDVNRP